MIAVREEGRRYVVDASIQTPNVPFGDRFRTLARYCITRTGSAGDAARVRVTVEVEFLARVMMRGQIESGALSGSIEYFAELLRVLTHTATTIGVPHVSLDAVKTLLDANTPLQLPPPHKKHTLQFPPRSSSMSPERPAAQVETAPALAEPVHVMPPLPAPPVESPLSPPAHISPLPRSTSAVSEFELPPSDWLEKLWIAWAFFTFLVAIILNAPFQAAHEALEHRKERGRKIKRG
ncbi:hypothetical protein BDK51DRAFT_29233 [Blyttiomyces helicus]|uniref:VASt domain-containing protein n=1 Tax=Blyttiomyces helicus TaxID=388810 RepID=A0A4P9WJT6_9FUNG|nr:hypothetical protein BDK51DRAFT_29233 [Blyttiomyces helicus]|eukprot:RKO91798.1 hypothetical protein BDK51DRAFT_29233 [Blyttiomyces helicus]